MQRIFLLRNNNTLLDLSQRILNRKDADAKKILNRKDAETQRFFEPQRRRDAKKILNRRGIE